MKWVVISVLFAALNVQVLAESGGYRLFDRQGQRSARPGDITVTAEDPESLPTKLEPGQKVEALSPMFTAIIKRAEAAVRRSPRKDATNIQRTEMQERNDKEMLEAIEPLVGKFVNASMIVEDVVEVDGQVMVVGKFNWRSEPVMTAAERQALADANAEARRKQEEIEERFKAERKRILDGDIYNPRTRRFERATGSYATSKPLRAATVKRDAEIKQAREEARLRLVELQKVSQDRPPIHMIYIFTNPERVASWRKGQTRAMKAVVQTAGLYIHHTNGFTPAPIAASDRDPRFRRAAARPAPRPAPTHDPDDTSASYVSAELVLRMIEDDRAQAEAVAPEPEGKAKASPPMSDDDKESAAIAEAIKEKRLEPGMTVAQAEESLGEKPVRISASGDYETYRWTIEEAGRKTVITARFRDGKLTTFLRQ